MELSQLIYDLQAAGEFDRLADNPNAQFGLRPESFLGAQLMPEQGVDGNVIEEESLRYRSVIANDAARYSPTQLKEGAALYGSMFAKLAENDIAKEFTAKQYDDVRKLLNRGGSMEAAARFLGWLDQEVNQALQRKNELYRWQALVSAAVTRVGDNGYAETVAYPDPTGHRIQVTADWALDANDPFDDLFAILEDAMAKNVQLNRAVMSSTTAFKILRNANVQNRAGNFTVLPDNTMLRSGPMAPPRLTGIFQSEGLPAPVIYDQTYHDSTGANRYLPENTIVFTGATGNAVEITPEDGDTFYLEDTLGYTGIGTPAGQDTAGRVINVEVSNRKPPRIEAEGYQTSLPVILNPEAVYVLDTTAP